MMTRHEHGLQGRRHTNITKRKRLAVKKDDEDVRRDSKKLEEETRTWIAMKTIRKHNKQEEIRSEET